MIMRGIGEGCQFFSEFKIFEKFYSQIQMHQKLNIWCLKTNFMPEDIFSKHYKLSLRFEIKIWQPIYQDGRQNQKLAYFS